MGCKPSVICHIYPIPAKILACSLWSRSVMLGSADSEHPMLISHEITSNVSPRPQYLNVTDGRTTLHYCHSNTVHCIASHCNNYKTSLMLTAMMKRKDSSFCSQLLNMHNQLLNKLTMADCWLVWVTQQHQEVMCKCRWDKTD